MYVIGTPYMEAVNATRVPFEYRLSQTDGQTNHRNQRQQTKNMAEYLLFQTAAFGNKGTKFV